MVRFVGRPAEDLEGKRLKVQFVLPRRTVTRLRERAVAENRPYSHLVRDAIEEYLERRAA